MFRYLFAVSLLFAAYAQGPSPASHAIPRLSVNRSLSPLERWHQPLHQALGVIGVQPFVSFYDTLLAKMQEKEPGIFDFYQTHLDSFREAYEAHSPDSIGEIRALVSALADFCEGEECNSLTWEKVFLAQMHMQIQALGPAEGECTSVVVRLANGTLLHVRNWDFGPLPQALGSASAQVDFFEGNHENQISCLLALTHITKWTTCIRPGGFSMSLNAREYGIGYEKGREPAEELRLMQLGRKPRIEVLREVMLQRTYSEALAMAASARPLTSLYVIIADAKSSNAAVVTLLGNGVSNDVLPMPLKGEREDDWFLVQTNVDHWLPTSQNATSSHRRDHVEAKLRALGQANANLESLLSLLQDQSRYPDTNPGPDSGVIFRKSTIASVLMRPSSDQFEPYVWKWMDLGSPILMT